MTQASKVTTKIPDTFVTFIVHWTQEETPQLSLVEIKRCGSILVFLPHEVGPVKDKLHEIFMSKNIQEGVKIRKAVKGEQ